MTFKEFVPAGSPGATLVPTGTNLQTVTATSTSGSAPTHTYATAAGLLRDAVGIATRVPESDDVGFATLRNTSAIAGKARVYAALRAAPSGTGEYQFMQLSSTGGRIIRFAIAGASHATLTPGVITVLDFAGTRIANTGVVWSVDTILHFYLGAQPGTTTSNGKGRAEIYSDADTSLFTLANGNVTGGNIDALNMGTTQNVYEVTAGRLTAAAGVPLNIDWTRLASNTDATAIPATSTLPFVAHATGGGGASTGYGGELVWVGDAWK